MREELGIDAQTQTQRTFKAHDHTECWAGYPQDTFDWYGAYLDSGEPVLVLRRRRA